MGHQQVLSLVWSVVVLNAFRKRIQLRFGQPRVWTECFVSLRILTHCSWQEFPVVGTIIMQWVVNSGRQPKVSFTAPLLCFKHFFGGENMHWKMETLYGYFCTDYTIWVLCGHLFETTNIGVWRGNVNSTIGSGKPHRGWLEVGPVHIVSNTRLLPEMTVTGKHTELSNTFDLSIDAASNGFTRKVTYNV